MGHSKSSNRPSRVLLKVYNNSINCGKCSYHGEGHTLIVKGVWGLSALNPKPASNRTFHFLSDSPYMLTPVKGAGGFVRGRGLFVGYCPHPIRACNKVIVEAT